jgi:hypothetical protein
MVVLDTVEVAKVPVPPVSPKNAMLSSPEAVDEKLRTVLP